MYLSDPKYANHLPQLPGLHLLLQLATLNHALLERSSPLLDSLQSSSTTAAAILQAVHRICRHLQQLAACHSTHPTLNRANSELSLHFKHQTVLHLLHHHTTLRQQLLDDVIHALLPPSSIHPLVRSFYSHLKRGRAGMGDYGRQHSYESFQQQWTAYSALLLQTPTFSTLCEQLKHRHSAVLPTLPSAPTAAADAMGDGEGGGRDGAGADDSVDMEFEGEYVAEAQLYEWLKQYRQRGVDGLNEAAVRAEWERVKDGTHDVVVAWMAQRGRQSAQQFAAEAVVAAV